MILAALATKGPLSSEVTSVALSALTCKPCQRGLEPPLLCAIAVVQVSCGSVAVFARRVFIRGSNGFAAVDDWANATADDGSSALAKSPDDDKTGTVDVFFLLFALPSREPQESNRALEGKYVQRV